MRALCFTIILTLFSMAAHASDADGRYTVLSLGNITCGKFIEDYAADNWEKINNSVWVGGYLSAINRYLDYGSNIAKNTDPSARDLWIYNYCEDNPLDQLIDASDALIVQLLERQK